MCRSQYSGRHGTLALQALEASLQVATQRLHSIINAMPNVKCRLRMTFSRERKTRSLLKTRVCKCCIRGGVLRAYITRNASPCLAQLVPKLYVATHSSSDKRPPVLQSVPQSKQQLGSQVAAKCSQPLPNRVPLPMMRPSPRLRPRCAPRAPPAVPPRASAALAARCVSWAAFCW